MHVHCDSLVLMPWKFILFCVFCSDTCPYSSHSACENVHFVQICSSNAIQTCSRCYVYGLPVDPIQINEFAFCIITFCAKTLTRLWLLISSYYSCHIFNACKHQTKQLMRFLKLIVSYVRLFNRSRNNIARVFELWHSIYMYIKDQSETFLHRSSKTLC